MHTLRQRFAFFRAYLTSSYYYTIILRSYTPPQKRKENLLKPCISLEASPPLLFLLLHASRQKKIVEKHFLSLFIPMSCSGRRKVFTATTAYHYYTYLKTSISPLLDRPLILCINKMTELRRCWVLFPPSCFKEGTGPLAYC